MDEWTNPAFACAWDTSALAKNPVRGIHLSLLDALVTGVLPADAAILDLGIGSGLVAEGLLAAAPGVRIVGIDSSNAMLALAHDRLRRFGDRVRLRRHDIADLASLDLASDSFVLTLSVQALHHLPHEDQRAALAHLYDLTAPGGWCAVIDRTLADKEPLYDALAVTSAALARAVGADPPFVPTYGAYLEYLRDKADFPVAAATLTAWLEEAGFVADLLHRAADRSFVIGRKL